MSFNKSLAAVRCVLQTIGNEVPSISEPLKKIIKQIQDDKLVRFFSRFFCILIGQR